MSAPPPPPAKARNVALIVVGVVIAAVVGLVAIVYGAIFLFAKVLNDAPEELSTEDLDSRLDATTLPPPAETTVVIDGSTPSTTAAPPTSSPSADPDDPSGDWVVGAGSEVGYRVPEILGGVDTEGVGRTEQVTGTMTIAGTQVTVVDVVVDVASITSDSDRRDGQFTGRIMDTATFPEATFVLTAPIELGAIPAPGEQITATATGDLTLRGVTREVTFDVTAQLDGGRVGVLGSIEITFADFDIPNPSNGFVTTGDTGLLEMLLVFDRV